MFLVVLQSIGVAYAKDGPDFLVGAVGEFGLVNVKTKTDAELDKSGTAVGFKGVVEIPRGSSLFHLGLGFDSVSLKGEDKKLDIKQDHLTQAGFMDVAWYWQFNEYIMPGLDLRAMRGPGANFSVADRKKTSMLYEIGPGVRFSYPKLTGDLDLVGQATWLMSVQNSDRRVNTFLVGIGVTYPIQLPKSEAVPPPPPPPPPAPVPEPKPQPAPIKVVPPPASKPDVVANLGKAFLQFEHGKAVPDHASLDRLAKLAKMLKENEANWTHLSIIGHTDATGKKESNLKLSKDRAKAVKDFLVKEGIAQDCLSSDGVGDTKLLSDLPPNASEHRRVELNFVGVKDIEAFNKSLEGVFGTNAKGK